MLQVGAELSEGGAELSATGGRIEVATSEVGDWGDFGPSDRRRLDHSHEGPRRARWSSGIVAAPDIQTLHGTCSCPLIRVHQFADVADHAPVLGHISFSPNYIAMMIVVTVDATILIFFFHSRRGSNVSPLPFVCQWRTTRPPANARWSSSKYATDTDSCSIQPGISIQPLSFRSIVRGVSKTKNQTPLITSSLLLYGARSSSSHNSIISASSHL